MPHAGTHFFFAAIPVRGAMNEFEPSGEDITVAGMVAAVTGSGSVLEEDDIVGAGTVARVTGDSSIVGEDDITAAGTVPSVTGSGSILEEDDIVGAGTVPSVIGSATLSSEEDINAAGTVSRVTGSGSILEEDDINVAGTVARVTGSGSILEEDDITGAGTVLRVIGASSISVSADPSATLTTDHTKVASNLSNFVTRINLASITDSTWWAAVIAGGGNIRVYNAAETTEYPIDVVKCNARAHTGEVFFRASLSSTADDVFHVKAVNGATAYANSATYGRNNVWQDYEAVFISDPIVNRSGRANATMAGVAPTAASYADSGSGLDTGCHQGVAWDQSTYFYVADTDALKKFNTSWTQQGSTVSGIVAASGLSSPYDHAGAPCYKGGELFIPMEQYPSTSGGGVYDHQQIAVFDTSLAFLRKYDISANHHEASALCWNADESVWAVVSYVDSTHIFLYDSSFNLVATITTPSITNKQGIAYRNGTYYISSDNYGIWATLSDGSSAWLLRPLVGTITDTQEGIAIDATSGDIYCLLDHGAGQQKVHTLTRGSVPADDWNGLASSGFGDGVYVATGLSKFTAWTMRSAAMLKTGGANRSFMSYSDNSSTDANRSTVAFRSSTTRFGMWNSTDSWLEDTSITYAVNTRYDIHQTFNGTTDRKIYRDGTLRATDLGTGQRPASTGDTIFMGAEDTSYLEIFNGWLNYRYLRNGVLSVDWISAEQASWVGTAFYTIS